MVWAPNAAAGTATLTHTIVHEPDRDYRYADVVYRARDGEANDLTATMEHGAVTLVDAGAPVKAGHGCRPVSRHEVRCQRRVGEYFSGAIHLGDGDDRFRGKDIYWLVHGGEGDDRLSVAGGAGGLTGGPGDDHLTGGIYEDTLSGGAGADVLSGGGDNDFLSGDGREGKPSSDRIDGGDGDGDQVSYANRSAPVTIDLGGGVASGAPREADTIRGVENAVGGRGSDRIVGTEGSNVLAADGSATGGRGGSRDERDVILGGGGDDELDGSPGADRLVGGRGADQLDGRGGGDVLSGGPDADGLDGGSGVNRYDAGGGDDAVDPGDGSGRSPLHCGSGDDYVNWPPPGQRVPHDCETVGVGEVDLDTRLVRLGAASLGLDVTDSGDRNEVRSCLAVVRLWGPYRRGGPRAPFLGQGEMQTRREHTHRMKIELTRAGVRTLLSGGRRTVPVRVRTFGRWKCSGHQPLHAFGPGDDITLVLSVPIGR